MSFIKHCSIDSTSSTIGRKCNLFNFSVTIVIERFFSAADMEFWWAEMRVVTMESLPDLSLLKEVISDWAADKCLTN